MTKYLRNVSPWLYTLVIVSIRGVSLVDKTTKGDSYFGRHFRMILSASMAPQLKSGNLLFSKDTVMNEVGLNDVVVVQVEQDYTTHRVVELNGSGRKCLLQTKGDNNDFVDQFTVTEQELKEKYLF